MSICVCGRTTRKPMCDKSCSLTEEQYQERTQRLQELFGKSKMDIKNENINVSRINSMSPEEIHEWYLTIKNSLDKLSRHYTVDEINRLKYEILEYERRHGLI
jgi:hypothetical protein